MIDKIDIQIAIAYLLDGLSQRKIEEIYLNGKSFNNGFKVNTKLKNLGIDGKHKGVLKRNNIDDEINNSTGLYKNTLIEIKKILNNNINNNLFNSVLSFPIIKSKKIFQPLTEQEKNKLITLLNNKIIEENGIKHLAIDMTGKNINVEFDILLKNRKKTTTFIFDEINKFLKTHTPNYVKYKYYDLQRIVKDILRSDDIYTYENTLKSHILEMLEVIVGHNYKTNYNICDQAYSYIEMLPQLNLIMALNGEYIDLKVNKEKSMFNLPTIVLYLENIWEYCEQNKFDYYEMIFTVLAHEYLHLHHYACLRKFRILKTSPGLNKYNPGKIIKESLASYFEREYSFRKNYINIVNNLSNMWNKNLEEYWPYAGAKNIRDVYHFSDIFYESIYSLKNALIIKNN